MSSTSGVPTNHQVRLAARPSGLPRATDWELTSEPAPEPGPGQVTVQVSHLSIDAVMRAGAVGRVTASEHPGFAVGDDVYGTFGVQDYAVSDGRGVMKIDTSLAGPSTYLGALGMTGLTAYFGLLDTGKLKDGETVVRSEEHTSELQSRPHLVCRLLLEKKKNTPRTQLQKKKKNKNNTNSTT